MPFPVVRCKTYDAKEAKLIVFLNFIEFVRKYLVSVLASRHDDLLAWFFWPLCLVGDPSTRLGKNLAKRLRDKKPSQQPTLSTSILTSSYLVSCSIAAPLIQILCVDGAHLFCRSSNELDTLATT